VLRRLDRAIRLHRDGYILTLSAGTPHRPPPLDALGFPIFESVAAARYLIAAGIAPARILTETHSYDTVGNAFFSRVLHADVRGFRRLLVITSDFHLARTRAVFDWIYGLSPPPIPYELEYEGVSDPAMDRRLLHDREEKERKSLEALPAIATRIATLRDCHEWLFTQHDAYNSAAKAFGALKLTHREQQSY
jgi:uncharacterized SAM-binding protein YcdF (DUF218 family)